LNKFSSQ